MYAQMRPFVQSFSTTLTLPAPPSHTNNPKPITFTLEISLDLGQASLSDLDKIVSSSYFEIPILDVVSFAALSSSRFHGVRRVGREEGKVKQRWLPELVTSGPVRQTQSNRELR